MIINENIVSSVLQCPVCRCELGLSADGKSALCNGIKKHCFDFSADGYLSFPQSSGGDSKAAVAARRSFLAKNYYLPAAEGIVNAVKKYVLCNSVIVDAGCGEGYYTSKLADISDAVVGFDLSKFACSAAAKSAKREGKGNLLYSTASVFELPVKSEVADAVVNIFAPCAEEEYGRILRDGGYLFVVGAGKDHLMGLKRAIYEDTYENGERADLPKNMTMVERSVVRFDIEVFGQDDIAALFSMTPYYWRTSESDKEKLALLDRLSTEIEFEINVYRKD